MFCFFLVRADVQAVGSSADPNPKLPLRQIRPDSQQPCTAAQAAHSRASRAQPRTAIRGGRPKAPLKLRSSGITLEMIFLGEHEAGKTQIFVSHFPGLMSIEICTAMNKSTHRFPVLWLVLFATLEQICLAFLKDGFRPFYAVVTLVG